MKLVTTKLSEKSFKNCCHGYKNSAINTQVKDHNYTLEKTAKN